MEVGDAARVVRARRMGRVPENGREGLMPMVEVHGMHML